MNTSIPRTGAIVSTVAVLGLWSIAAMGQERGASSRDDAVLIVDGVVREVFRSPRQDRVDYLVEIEVQRTQADRVPRAPRRVAMPAPGDIVYVHVRPAVRVRAFRVRTSRPAMFARLFPPSGLRCALTSRQAHEGAGKGPGAIGSNQPLTSSPTRTQPTRRQPLRNRLRPRRQPHEPTRLQAVASRPWPRSGSLVKV
jgi:hypothetical protein